MIQLKTILMDHPLLFTPVTTSQDETLFGVATPENSAVSTVCFLSQPQHIELIQSLKSSVWITTETFWSKNETALKSASLNHPATVLTCKNLQVAMAHVLRYFDRRPELMAFPVGVSAQSWIHPSTHIESGVTIAPFVTIGPNVKIGKGTIIGPHTTIEGEVEIGTNCLLESQIFVGRQTQIGNDCRIKPFASIASDGYGYAPLADGILKIPQIGKVILEDQVDIGSGTCIDRATLTQTRIGQGTKIDNLVHIAHNCDIGKYCFITACFAVAGSTKIGDYFVTGGSSCVGDHVTIVNKVTLAGATVVTSDIEKPGAYGGNPVQPMSEYLRTRSSTAQLPAFRKQLSKVLKKLEIENI